MKAWHILQVPVYEIPKLKETLPYRLEKPVAIFLFFKLYFVELRIVWRLFARLGR